MKTIPRILFVSQTALGTSTTNRYIQLCTHLARNGYRVTLFFIGKGKAAQDCAIRYPRRIGPVAIRHSAAIPAALLQKTNAVTAVFAAAFLLLTCIPRLLLACFRRDVIVLGKPLPLGAFVTLLCAAITRKPVVLDADDWEGVGGFATIKQGGNAFAKAVITFFEEWTPARCAAVVVVSRLLYERMRYAGVQCRDLFCVPNGADIERFNPAIDGGPVRTQLSLDDKTVLAYLGTFKPGGANWRFILDSVHEVCRCAEKAALMIIGFGPQLDDARAYAKRLGIEHRVVCAGKVEHECVPQFLAAADILILPYSADFPDTFINTGRSSLKLYEYMAMGKPIVASDIGELHEALKDGGGVLVQANVAPMFGRKIIELINDPAAMRRYGNEARKRAEEKYNYEALAKDFAQALDHAAKSRAR